VLSTYQGQGVGDVVAPVADECNLHLVVAVTLELPDIGTPGLNTRAPQVHTVQTPSQGE
jgi:hypothetical protein